MNGGLMTIEDLAGYLKVTRRTIYDWLKQNKIPAIKLIGQWRFKRDKIDAWLENKAVHQRKTPRPIAPWHKGLPSAPFQGGWAGVPPTVEGEADVF